MLIPKVCKMLAKRCPGSGNVSNLWNLKRFNCVECNKLARLVLQFSCNYK